MALVPQTLSHTRESPGSPLWAWSGSEKTEDTEVRQACVQSPLCPLQEHDARDLSPSAQNPYL